MYEINLLTLLQTTLEHNTIILYQVYLTIPDLTSRQINLKARKDLSSNNDIVIPEAEKGGAITIIS